MSKTLIGITTCHPYRDRAAAIRNTWAREVEHADVRFFFGRGPKLHDDEVILDCPDGYQYLTHKTQLMRRWAIAQDYDRVIKADDDCYLRPERLAKVAPLDYIGRLRGPSGNYPAPYCSGFCYVLSRRALEALAPIEWQSDDDFAEDRWTGNQLLRLAIAPVNDPHFIVEYSKNSAVSGREPPLRGNRVVASCEYRPDLMHTVHQQFHSGRLSQLAPYRQPAGSLARVAIMIKTFLRDGFLMKCLDGLEENFADAKWVIVDDGRECRPKITRYAELRRKHHACIWLPFDSGFGAKANAAIPHCDREYVLIGSDDFDFSDPRVRPGVERMQTVLDRVPSLGLVSGRVDGNPYEFCWEPGVRSLREIPGWRGTSEVEGVTYHPCDLTVNYSLIRRKVFESEFGGLHWDGGDVKIGGGEHAAFFLDLQKVYWGVAYVEGANICQLRSTLITDEYRAWNSPEYPKMRARARQPGRPCLKARGIDTYILGDGTVEQS
jgi:hypothetical protein